MDQNELNLLLSTFMISLLILIWPNTGGNGGRGGDVVLECSATVWDFSSLQHHIVCYLLPHSLHYDCLPTSSTLVACVWGHLCVGFLLCKSFINSSSEMAQNARRGGNGAPKNMIGSRGADKVIFMYQFVLLGFSFYL